MAKKKKKAKKAVVVWGRPRKYDDPVEFERECQRYFETLKFNAPNIARKRLLQEMLF